MIKKIVLPTFQNCIRMKEIPYLKVLYMCGNLIAKCHFQIKLFSPSPKGLSSLFFHQYNLGVKNRSFEPQRPGSPCWLCQL